MTISVAGFSKIAPVNPVKAPSAGTAFAGALSRATSSVNAAFGDRAEISAAAQSLSDKASTTSPIVDESTWDALMRLPDKEFWAEAAKKADAISASQGLPPGKYDFTKMSSGQLLAVNANMIGNLGYPASELNPVVQSIVGFKPDGGALMGGEFDWTSPRNLLAEMNRNRDLATSTNDPVNAAILDAAIQRMKAASVVNANNSRLFKASFI